MASTGMAVKSAKLGEVICHRWLGAHAKAHAPIGEQITWELRADREKAVACNLPGDVYPVAHATVGLLYRAEDVRQAYGTDCYSWDGKSGHLKSRHNPVGSPLASANGDFEYCNNQYGEGFLKKGATPVGFVVDANHGLQSKGILKILRKYGLPIFELKAGHVYAIR